MIKLHRELDERYRRQQVNASLVLDVLNLADMGAKLAENPANLSGAWQNYLSIMKYFNTLSPFATAALQFPGENGYTYYVDYESRQLDIRQVRGNEAVKRLDPDKATIRELRQILLALPSLFELALEDSDNTINIATP